MAHEHDKDARRSFGDKLDNMTGSRGEHPVERAARIAGVKVNASAQGDSGAAPEEWTRSPSKQISNYGNVRK